MIKVTFQTGNSGVYWAVCETFSLHDNGAYVLCNVFEDSRERGPTVWLEIPAGWQVLRAEEV